MDSDTRSRAKPQTAGEQIVSDGCDKTCNGTNRHHFRACLVNLSNPSPAKGGQNDERRNCDRCKNKPHRSKAVKMKDETCDGREGQSKCKQTRVTVPEH